MILSFLSAKLRRYRLAAAPATQHVRRRGLLHHLRGGGVDTCTGGTLEAGDPLVRASACGGRSRQSTNSTVYKSRELPQRANLIAEFR